MTWSAFESRMVLLESHYGEKNDYKNAMARRVPPAAYPGWGGFRVGFGARGALFGAGSLA